MLVPMGVLVEAGSRHKMLECRNINVVAFHFDLVRSAYAHSVEAVQYR